MSNLEFEKKIRIFLYHKGLISEPVYNLKREKWDLEKFKNGKHKFGVHLEVTSDLPYHCFEVYSEVSTTEPNRDYWEKIQSKWQKEFKNSKKELHSLFGEKIPNLTVELYIVYHNKKQLDNGEYDFERENEW